MMKKSELIHIIKEVLNEEQGKLLIPRRLEGRRERYIKLIRTQLQQKHIEGTLDLRDLPEITDLGNVETVSGYLDLTNSNVESLGNLKSVGGFLNLYNSKVESLGNLQSVGKSLYFWNSNVESLGNLQSVGGDLYLWNSKIKSLGNLQKVGEIIYLSKDHKIPEELMIEYRKKFKILIN